MLSISAFAETHEVTQAEALVIAQKEFQGRDVDYYIRQDNNQTFWTIFVDAEPTKGWEHECYTLSIHKTISIPVEYARVFIKTTNKLPPSGTFIPLSVKNRYGANSSIKPSVNKVTQSNSAQKVAQRTYAVILNGGWNCLSNYERYWNDCSFIYQTLVNKYGVPKANIFPIMSDGNNPDLDMISNYGVLKSQSLDLDNDGVADINLAATKSNIQNTLNNLESKLQQDDQLFFYVIDHGGSSDYKNNSYICLWNQEKLTDSELASMLKPFTDKYVNVNVVLGQCYSGGFIDDLTKVGCVVATASAGSEPSWSCSDIPYDEFVYQWTCAVNGADYKKVAVNADTDGNGYVSMKEAFEYAKAHDRRSEEHPQYISTPISVGEDLAFNHIAESVDLYIKDNPEDTGAEPNMTTEKFWLSPSIWIRNNADGGTEHENPFYSVDHTSVTVYVRVHNRGKQEYKGGTQYVHVYWAKAATGFRPDVWMGDETYDNGEVTGGFLLPPSVIDKIPAGEYLDVKVPWALPPDLFNGEKHHFCLLVKITNTHKEPWFTTGVFTYHTKESNNDAQKNVSIIGKEELSEATKVFVRNIHNVTRKYTLELSPRTTGDDAIFSHASVMMEMSQPIYSAWERGGSQANGISRAPAISPRAVQFLSKESRLDAISLSGYEFDKVDMKFNFKTASASQRKYTLDLIQRDEDGKIIGGETFVVESPDAVNRTVAIASTPIDDGKTLLSVDVDPNESVRWETEDGTIIGEKESVQVLSYGKSDNKYYVYVLSENGELASDCIELDSETGIDRILMDKQKKVVEVYLKGQNTGSPSIVISSVLSGETVLSYDLSEDETSVSLDLSSLKQGIYVVAYICNGEIINSVKIAL